MSRPRLRTPRLPWQGLRARLVAVYLLIALVVVGVGTVVAVRALDRHLRAGLDATLAARAGPFLTALAEPDTVDLPRTAAERPGGRVSDGLIVVQGADGTARFSEPASAAVAVVAALPPAGPGTGTMWLNRRVDNVALRLRIDTVTRTDGTWRVVTGQESDTTTEALDRVRQAVGVLIPLLLIAVTASTWALAGAALRPVERMRAHAAALGAADSDARLPVPATGDELQALGVTLNDLLDRLHRSLSAQRDFIADAGHELRTPLAIMSAELELAARPGRSPEELRSALDAARAETARLAELAEDLLLLATAPNRTDEPLDLTDVLTEATAARAGTAQRAGIELSCQPNGPCPARGDSRGLRRAVDNLLSNALAHTPPGGRVQVTLARTATHVDVTVTDTGPGFPPSFLPHAFTRFRRSDPARTTTGPGGTGLGLAIVSAIAEQHRGCVSAANNTPSPGARVTITLPTPADDAP